MNKNLINILIIGKKSFLTNCFKRHSKIKKIKIISYKEIEKINLDKFSHILNFSIDPKNFTHHYNKINKIDKKICNLLSNKNCTYIFPSSRLVYSSEKKNFYGKNKKKTEKDIKKYHKKFLILRIGTILMYDVSKRNLFISKVLRTLKNRNVIELDIPLDTRKDFLTSKAFVEILEKLIMKDITGIFNLSSNISVKVKDVLGSILRGYGKGKIIIKKKLKKNHSFLLNNKKLKKKIAFKISKKDILNYSLKLGKKLNA